MASGIRAIRPAAGVLLGVLVALTGCRTGFSGDFSGLGKAGVVVSTPDAAPKFDLVGRVTDADGQGLIAVQVRAVRVGELPAESSARLVANDVAALIGNHAAGLVANAAGALVANQAAGLAAAARRTLSVDALTDVEGRFRLQLPAGRYNLEAIRSRTDKGWAANILVGADVVSGEVRLSVSPVAVLGGKVTLPGAPGDRPSPGGEVLIAGSAYVARVAADGTWQLPDVPAGQHDLVFWHPDFGAARLFGDAGLLVLPGVARTLPTLRLAPKGQPWQLGASPVPVASPSVAPTPTTVPTVTPSAPAVTPTPGLPSPEPTQVVASPTASPSPQQTAAPTFAPSPVVPPTAQPTVSPSAAPAASPATERTPIPDESQLPFPLETPTPAPTPSTAPSSTPTAAPSVPPDPTFFTKAFYAQGDRIKSVDFSEDAKLFVLGYDGGAVTVGDMVSGNPMVTWQLGSSVRGVSIGVDDATRDPDTGLGASYMVTSATDGGRIDQRRVSGNIPPVLVTPVASLSTRFQLYWAFSTGVDGRVWAGGNGNKAAVYDLATGAESLALSAMGWVRAGDARGGRLAYGADDWMARVVNLADGTAFFSSPFQSGPVTAVSLSGDGGRVAVGGGDGKIRVYDVATGAELRRFTIETGGGGSSEIRAAALTPDGQWLAYGGTDGVVHLGSMADGRVVADFRPGGTVVNALRFTTDGTPTGKGNQLLVGTQGAGAILYEFDW
ncbi:MAG: hypothetical protein VKO64_06920 [Candidatus Sericytochromatia bacterium]|nr:hypothetical protein [Candidatus Sericytochromatia bacterium]